MEFIESPLFTRLIYDYMDDVEYSALQIEIISKPDAGTVIPGSGGIRKLRWSGKGKGKRGGLRIIYYWQKSKSEIWFLTIYAKNEIKNMPLNILHEIRKEIKK